MTSMITSLEPHQVFVFGSNLNGNHAGGAARQAKEQFGAVEGQCTGWHGQSYAIPTLGTRMEKLSLADIQKYLYELEEIARKCPYTEFLLTPIGTGIAGFSLQEIKSILPDFPRNVKLVGDWEN